MPINAGNSSTINQSAVKGEAGTGYEGPDGKGEFECGNCSFYSNGTCGQQDMMAKSQQPKDASGRVQVDPEGCCEYVDRKAGSSDNDQDDQGGSPGSLIMNMGSSKGE